MTFINVINPPGHAVCQKAAFLTHRYPGLSEKRLAWGHGATLDLLCDFRQALAPSWLTPLISVLEMVTPDSEIQGPGDHPDQHVASGCELPACSGWASGTLTPPRIASPTRSRQAP
jgi:hypothetical protein